MNQQRLIDLLREDVVPLQYRIIEALEREGILHPHFSNGVLTCLLHLSLSLLIEEVASEGIRQTLHGKEDE